MGGCPPGVYDGVVGVDVECGSSGKVADDDVVVVWVWGVYFVFWGECFCEVLND